MHMNILLFAPIILPGEGGSVMNMGS